MLVEGFGPQAHGFPVSAESPITNRPLYLKVAGRTVARVSLDVIIEDPPAKTGRIVEKPVTRGTLPDR
jgi:hypothetical protein